MRRATLLALAVALTLALTGEAQAVTLVNPDGTVAQPYQHWADQSKMPTVRERIVVQQGAPDCRTSAACSNETGGVIEVDPARVDAGVFTFELGHWFALRLDHAAVARIAGMDGAPWFLSTWPIDGAGSVEGAFVTSYETCATLRLSVPDPLCTYALAVAHANPSAFDQPASAAHHRKHHHRANARRRSARGHSRQR